MCCSPRPSRARQTRPDRAAGFQGLSPWPSACRWPMRPRRRSRSSTVADAEHRRQLRRRPPVPTPTLINSDVSAGATVHQSRQHFLERLGGLASSGFGRALRTNPGGGGASEATERAALPDLGRGLRHLGPHRCAGRFRRRSAQRPGAASPASARRSRPASTSASRSTRAVPRSTFRWRCSRRRSTSPSSASTLPSTRDRGPGRSRWSTVSARSIRAVTPASACASAGYDAADRRRAHRDQLLLDHRPEPYRAESRARICAGHDRIVSGGRWASTR